MLSGFHRAEELASPAFRARRTNVEPFSTAEATVGPRPAPAALGALQNIMGSLCVPPPNAQGFALTQLSTPPMNKSHGRQRLLAQGQLSKSPSDAVSTTSNGIHRRHPRLVELLTSSNDSHESLSNLPKGPLQQSANASVSSSTASAQPSGSKPYLTDDQILVLIEKKLQMFRAQMKVLKERASTHVDPHQGPSCNTPASTEPGKAPVNDTVRTIGGEELSNGSRQGPQRPQLKSSQTKRHSEEYVPITPETAAIGSKEEDSPVVLKALSGQMPVDLFKPKPSHTVHDQPSYQESGSTRRNGNPGLGVSKELHIPQRNVTKEVDIVSNVGDSSRLSKSLKTSYQQRHVTNNQSPHTMEVSEKNRPVSAAGRDDLTLHLSLNVDIVKSSVANYHQVIEPEPEWKEEMQERAVPTGEGSVYMEVSPSISEGSSILKDLKYDDVTEDEDSDVMPQLFTFDNDGQTGASEQSTDVNIYANAPFLQPAVTPTPKQQGPEITLSCSCPYFVETDDGFEKIPCPKCAKDALPIIQEVQSEDESDEEVILFVTELELKEEAIVVDSEGEEEEQNVSSPEQHNQCALFQKIKVYDTFDSFYQSELIRHNKIVPNPLKTIRPASAEPGPSPRSLPKPLAAEKVASEQGSSHSSLQKHLDTVEKAPELPPAPRPLGIFEKFSCEPGPSSLSDAEDSCDTEDSSDYPSHTKYNHLTASSQVQALSLQSCDPDVAAEGESHRPPEEASNAEDWFPDLSEDEPGEDKKSTNRRTAETVLPKTTSRSADNTEPGVSKTFRKAKAKTRRVIYSDSESENDQDTSKTFRRSFSSENGQVSTQPLKPSIKPSSKCEKSIKPVRSKSRAVSFDLTPNQNGSKTLKRTLSADSADASTQPPNSALKPRTIHQAVRPDTHGQVLNVQRSTIKRKSQTDHKRSQKVKRKRPSPEVKTLGIAHPGHEVTAQKRILSLPGQNCIASSLPPRNPIQPTSNTSRNPTRSISNIIRNQSPPSLPASRNQSQATACTVQRHSQPSPHIAQRQSSQTAPNYSVLNPSQVTSTSAKEVLNKKWANDHVPIRKERRSSHDAARTTLPKTVSRMDQDVSRPRPKARQRNNSHELQTPLMRKTKSEAQKLTKAGHRVEPPSIGQHISDGYKWGGGSPAEEHGEDWLDRMHGDNFQRPHF